MNWLKDSSYCSLRIVQLDKLIAGEMDCSNKVLITFDDALACQLDLAVPILMELDLSATFFIPTAFIGESRQTFQMDSTLASYQGEEAFSWEDIRSLDGNGFEIGSHTHTHPRMTELSPKAGRDELRISKEMIEEQLRHSISSFAYPYGTRRMHSKTTTSLTTEIGFKYACTTQWGGINHRTDKLALPRIAIKPWDTLSIFRQKVSGAYEFLEYFRR